MPLDGHSYLVAQGWSGKGTGLRQGAISRPLAIPQKRTLAGVGKDRDEAFPFWDHLFSAAAKSIQVKCLSDDEEEGDSASTSSNPTLKRTSTGILSTRRPLDGTPADSDCTTPNEVESDSQTSRLSLIAQAKRDAAKRGLYSRFFRGPVHGPETIAEEERRLEELISKALDDEGSKVKSIKVTEHIEVELADAQVVVNLEVSTSSKKRKARDESENSEWNEDKAARKERKRRRKQEEKDAKEELKKGKKEKSNVAKALASAEPAEPTETTKSETSKHRQAVERPSNDPAEDLKRRRKEKKRLKALREQEESGTVSLEEPVTEENKSSKSRKQSSSKSKIDYPEKTTTPEEDEEKEKKKKKKRKRQDGLDE
ncbi:hypothetical protein CPB84DRAFT_1703262 [Gymnopilus junonius]|uniref:G-patch domain-containing protein n=1 Tax=Gymnopilus junonius TaxID=109634 RepID=A0A9P5NXM1_GYMJU|nr:hypothetical protein CPB84DRAFT_1703262 [Gymnopilus junonius]